MKTTSRRRWALGRDLALLGALAFDVTHSRVQLDDNSVYGNKTLDGNSYRVSYAKDFDELNSRVTFAGYRFSEKKLHDHERVSGCERRRPGAHR
ncbi:fimbria/pilus outer membrane usher protein [Escherichia coli]|nr:fimbria/pilus outer membrane usher protein [Escherichia coli]